MINIGKIILLTGEPGTGKSTCAQLLARDYGYVYYEADCFLHIKNPYLPLDVDNPTMASITQKPLKGPGMEERKCVFQKLLNCWDSFMQGKEYDREAMSEYYRLMAVNIASEKKRIGGDFAVAVVLFTADSRAIRR